MTASNKFHPGTSVNQSTKTHTCQECWPYLLLYRLAPSHPLKSEHGQSTLLLRAYITNDQFSQIKLGQKVKVFIDSTDAKYKEYEGTVTWISDKAEFTPKTIETKDERANLVWAVKIAVKNDGYLKIGMYADVKFK